VLGPNIWRYSSSAPRDNFSYRSNFRFCSRFSFSFSFRFSYRSSFCLFFFVCPSRYVARHRKPRRCVYVLNLGGTGITPPDSFSYRSNFRFRSSFRSRSNFRSSFSFSFRSSSSYTTSGDIFYCSGSRQLNHSSFRLFFCPSRYVARHRKPRRCIYVLNLGGTGIRPTHKAPGQFYFSFQFSYSFQFSFSFSFSL